MAKPMDDPVEIFVGAGQWQSHCICMPLHHDLELTALALNLPDQAIAVSHDWREPIKEIL
jgi:hypothetical protein